MDHVRLRPPPKAPRTMSARSEEHTSELQSRLHLVCRLLLEKKQKRLKSAPPRPQPALTPVPPPATYAATPMMLMDTIHGVLKLARTIPTPPPTIYLRALPSP